MSCFKSGKSGRNFGRNFCPNPVPAGFETSKSGAPLMLFNIVYNNEQCGSTTLFDAVLPNLNKLIIFCPVPATQLESPLDFMHVVDFTGLMQVCHQVTSNLLVISSCIKSMEVRLKAFTDKSYFLSTTICYRHLRKDKFPFQNRETSLLSTT